MDILTAHIDGMVRN